MYIHFIALFTQFLNYQYLKHQQYDTYLYTDIVQETGSKTNLKKKECKKAKWLSKEALQIAVKRREAKSKGDKQRFTHVNAEFQRIAKSDKKAFLSDQCKEIEENNTMGKTRDLFWRRQWHPTPVLLPGKSHGWRSLVGYSPRGC